MLALEKHNSQLKHSPSNQKRIVIPQDSDDPEIVRKLANFKCAAELIKYWEYPFEEHFSQTQDGYEVGMYRISNGHLGTPNLAEEFPCKKPAVLIWHGLSISCDVFLCNTARERNMALVLADAGYDVWLANTRGSKYSKGHQDESKNSIPNKKSSKSSSKSERLNYWEFSIDHFANYDVPSAIDYILEHTGRQKLSYIGYSQGTSQVFAALSLNDELNQKLNVVLAMAPALKPKPISNNIINNFIRTFEPKILFPVLGQGSFLPIVHTIKQVTPSSIFTEMVESSFLSLLGWDCAKFGPKNRRQSLYAHLFSDCSVANLVHWFQIMLNDDGFCKYDEYNNSFSPRLPTKFSPRTCALKYPTRLIKSKIHLFCGEVDTISDLDYLKTHLPDHTSIHIIEDYGHMDFLWATCAKEKCWSKMIDILDEVNEIN